jgi:hypothetical protein
MISPVRIEILLAIEASFLSSETSNRISTIGEQEHRLSLVEQPTQMARRRTCGPEMDAMHSILLAEGRVSKLSGRERIIHRDAEHDREFFDHLPMEWWCTKCGAVTWPVSLPWLRNTPPTRISRVRKEYFH